MADIFISYSSHDRAWANWIGQALQELGHTALIHKWEIPAGGGVSSWVERLQVADRVLCVVSKAYLAADYSSRELEIARLAAENKRPNFVLPVFVENCAAPASLADIKRCDLYGVGEDEARAQLTAYLSPAARPSGTVRFPGSKPAIPASTQVDSGSFPGRRFVLSNIPIAVPQHFVGREDAIQAVDAEFEGTKRPVAAVVVLGMRGVGKTTLAAAYAERRRADYRATWWIRAETEATMRADLVALGVRLGWVAADEKEEPALATVRERLRDEGEGLLLIYDNAIDAESVRDYLPLGGLARVLVTSNAPAWRASRHAGRDRRLAEGHRRRLSDRPHRPRKGARRGRSLVGNARRPTARARAGRGLLRAAGPFARRVRRRFEAAPSRLLDTDKDAPGDYHNKLTAAKAFALAIDEAAKLHPAAEPLIVHAALLAPEPIPLFLFSEGREKFGEPLASLLADDGLDEAVAALRAFALVDRETIPDERDPAIETASIRLHRLVRTVAAARLQGDAAAAAKRALIEAMAAVYPLGRVQQS